MEEDQKPGEGLLRRQDEGVTSAMATTKTPGDNEQNTKGVEDKVGHIGPFKHWTHMSVSYSELQTHFRLFSSVQIAASSMLIWQ